MDVVYDLPILFIFQARCASTLQTACWAPWYHTISAVNKRPPCKPMWVYHWPARCGSCWQATRRAIRREEREGKGRLVLDGVKRQPQRTKGKPMWTLRDQFKGTFKQGTATLSSPRSSCVVVNRSGRCWKRGTQVHASQEDLRKGCPNIQSDQSGFCRLLWHLPQLFVVLLESRKLAVSLKPPLLH